MSYFIHIIVYTARGGRLTDLPLNPLGLPRGSGPHLDSHMSNEFNQSINQSISCLSGGARDDTFGGSIAALRGSIN